MNLSYALTLVLILILSPFILLIASKQNKNFKQSLKNLFLIILLVQTLLGFLNWENFSVGRSGFELAFTYPESFLNLFFIVTLIQIILSFLNRKFYAPAVILNFINTFILFIGMIRIGQITGIQSVSWASVGTTFAVLIGNVVGLIFINRDKNLLKKYFK